MILFCAQLIITTPGGIREPLRSTVDELPDGDSTPDPLYRASRLFVAYTRLSHSRIKLFAAQRGTGHPRKTRPISHSDFDVPRKII